MNYRRAKTEGGTFFFTLVTYNRRPFLCEPENVDLLREAIKVVKRKHPFILKAIVLMPDHLHCIWTLPRGDWDFSSRWRLIKGEFTRRCDRKIKEQPSFSRQRKKEQAIWQRRFWEHQITDEQDFIRHVEYVHYNPVKHGYVKSPKEWKFSSFDKYVDRGIYDQNWGIAEIDLDATIGNE